MSTKTKRLSQLLFRRSSTNSTSTKSHFIRRELFAFDDDKEEITNEKSSLMPQIVDSASKYRRQMVVFAEKSPRARSSSPGHNRQRSRSNDVKLISILKNGENRDKLQVEYDENGHYARCNNGQLFGGKTTLQRTKSNPNPSARKSVPKEDKSIEERNKSVMNSNNPLQDVSWSCPTLEKRKEVILNYFKNIAGDSTINNIEATDKNLVDPIYEEIRPKNTNMNSLKPKIAPKKVRINIPPQNNADSSGYSSQSPIYDRVLNRSHSFNHHENNLGHQTKSISSEQFQSFSKSTPKLENVGLEIPTRDADSFNFNLFPLSPNSNLNPSKDIKCSLQSSSKGLADFASEVAQHAKTNRSNSFSNFPISSSSSSSSSNYYDNDYVFENGVLANDTINTNRRNQLIDQNQSVDEIYNRIDKRGRKVGTPTTRLLKKHHVNYPIRDDNNNGLEEISLDNFKEQDIIVTKSSNQLKIKASSTIGEEQDFMKTNNCPIVNLELTPTSKSGNNNKSQKTKVKSNIIAAVNEKGVIAITNNAVNDANINRAISTVTTTRITIGDFNIEEGGNSCSSDDSGLSEVPLVVTSEKDSYYNSSSSEESESLQQPVQLHIPAHVPVKPPRACKTVGNISANFITTVNVDKPSKEKDLNKPFKNDSVESQKPKVINLADLFPPIGKNNTETFSHQIINVIDSTDLTPKSYPVVANLPEILTTHERFENFENIYENIIGNTNHTKNKVLTEDPNNNNSGTLNNPEQNVTKPEQDKDTTHKDFCGEDKIHKNSQHSAEDNKNLLNNNGDIHSEDKMSAVMTNTQGELNATSGLLIETQNLWDSSPTPSSSSSPTSHSSESTLNSTTSDLSEELSGASGTEGEITITLLTDQNSIMSYEKQERNQFNRQNGTKFYDDIDEDGGFESFQVVDADESNYRYYDEDENENAPFSPPSSAGSPDMLGISESAANRQRTFAQSQQNIPTKELHQKASSVLDLINAEISDLHLRELELKRKNRVADGKEYDSEDLIEGSSQADSDDYSDSAVDVESFSRTSGSSGNVTPASNQNRDGSPHSERGSYHPADADKEAKLGDFGDEKTVVEEVDAQEISTLAETTSSLVADLEIEKDETGLSTNVHNNAIVTHGNKQQQGVKVRPIVEEEVKSIELSVTKETPIEREIRLVREREEEFRQLRSLSSIHATNSFDSEEPSSPSLNVQQQIVNNNAEQNKPAKQNITVAPVAKSAFSSDVSANARGPKDIQYEMATARLKREIEENMMRERELFREGRLKSMSVAENLDKSDSSEDAPVQSEESPSHFEEIEQAVENSEEVSTMPATRKSLVRLSSSPAGQSFDGVQTSTPKPSGPSSVRFFSPPAYSKESPVPSPITTPQFTFQNQETKSLTQNQQNYSLMSSTQSQSLTSLSISKPQFTSIEKMILKGSFSFNKNSMPEEPKEDRSMTNLSMGKISNRPDPLQIVHRVESIDETEEDNVFELEFKPRRKYIPAQDKIQIELQEQIKREKELSQIRAKWKSTPDLLQTEEDHVDIVEETTATTVDAENNLSGGIGMMKALIKPGSKMPTSSTSSSPQKIVEVSTSDVLRMNKPTLRRRHSALINQWEEMIKQQQEKNKN